MATVAHPPEISESTKLAVERTRLAIVFQQ
jgi:hypothetical protein